MKILIALRSGVIRLPGLWRGALFIWFLSFLLASAIAFPLKGVLRSGFGNSMITEKLAHGLNVEVFSDLGATLRSLISFFSVGLLMVLLLGFLLNTFFSGGLFNSLKDSSSEFNLSDFFSGSLKFFWSFLFISIIIYSLILIIAFILMVLPLAIVAVSESPADRALFKTGVVVFPIFIFLLIILILTADYARAWQVTKDKNQYFRAIAFGIKQTLRTIGSSFLIMLILIGVQILFGWFVVSILPLFNPVKGSGVFLIFLFSQILFFIKIFLKIWRYGSITALLEETNI